MDKLGVDAALSAGGAGQVPPPKPMGVYLIAIFFTGEWLFFMGSLVFTLFHTFSPEMRTQFLASPAIVSTAISELNGLLMVVGSWLLLSMRRIGATLFLVSTLLLFGLGALSWPFVLHIYMRAHNPSVLHSLAISGSNLVLHIAATIYAFHLNRRGLLR